MQGNIARTAGALFINSDGKVLLGLRSPSKKVWPLHWDTIGGRVEDGESLDDALIREAREEVGVTPVEFRLIATVRERRPEIYGDALHHIYAVTGWRDGDPANVCDEHTELKWFSISEMSLLSNIVDADYPLFARLAVTGNVNQDRFDREKPMEQRFAFDQVAEVYRAARPDYPDALVDDVVSYAGLKPNDRILEVGCGTGQATKGFAKRGFPILATDPGSEMLRGARESLAGFSNIQFLETTFEALPIDRAAFRLIVAAQSWHWVSPEVRFSKAAEVLSPGGSLAVFGHVPVGLPAPLLDRFKEIYLRQIGKWGPPPEAWYLPSGPFEGWFNESGVFGPVEHKCYPWKWQHTTSSYADFLRTRSDHRMMEPAKRDEVLGEIAEAIDGEGGQFDMDYETHLYVARLAVRN